MGHDANEDHNTLTAVPLKAGQSVYLKAFPKEKVPTIEAVVQRDVAAGQPVMVAYYSKETRGMVAVTVPWHHVKVMTATEKEAALRKVQQEGIEKKTRALLRAGQGRAPLSKSNATSLPEEEDEMPTKANDTKMSKKQAQIKAETAALAKKQAGKKASVAPKGYTPMVDTAEEAFLFAHMRGKEGTLVEIDGKSYIMLGNKPAVLITGKAATAVKAVWNGKLKKMSEVAEALLAAHPQWSK